jgi:hypothetical protein
MKGAKTTSQRTDVEGNPLGEFDSFWNLRYLEVPVLLRGTLLRGAAVQPMWYLGPTIGISLGGTFTSDLAHDVDLTDLKPLDLGVAIGAGAGFRTGGHRVLTELRYATGLTDLYDIKNNAESVNQVVSVTVGVAF